MREFKDYKFAVIRGKTAFFVRSVGHFRVLPDNREGIKTADFGEIFWCLEGKGLFSLNGRRHTLLPGQVWYYPPGARHDYIPGDPLFHYRWLSLEGPGTKTLFDGLHILPGLNAAGVCPEELFARIELEIESADNAARMRVLAAAFEILTRIASPAPKPEPEGSTAERIKAVIERNFTNPELNVDRIAELLGLHRVTLSRAFSACYGHSVIEHLIACRVNHALHLLKDPHRSIEETARASGFSSPEYFARTIRRITGSSPAKLRGK